MADAASSGGTDGAAPVTDGAAPPSDGAVSGCAEVTISDLRRTAVFPGVTYEGKITPPLGGAASDAFYIELFDPPSSSGPSDLSAAPDDDYATCVRCLNANEDVVYTQDGDVQSLGRKYFQASGTVDLGPDGPMFISGSAVDVTLVEVTLGAAYHTTPVPGGACLHITRLDFAFPAPPPQWTCNSADYGDIFECSCGCGAHDPSCDDPSLPVVGCEPGQTCKADGSACKGVPSTWTCDPAAFGDGRTCDCKCGARDPDCTVNGAPVRGCATGELCGGFELDICYPAAWTCLPVSYGDAICDCGCGVRDIDCPDARKSSCENCEAIGACDAVPCSDPASRIRRNDNAACN